jgi:hypothetical protein
MSTARKLPKSLRELAEKPSSVTAVSSILHGLREKALLELIASYCNSERSDDLFGLSLVLLRALGEIEGRETSEQEAVIRKASQELRKSRPGFQAAMTWLCSAKAAEREFRIKAHQLGKVQWGRFPFIDKTSETFIRYFEIHGLTHFRSRLSLQNGRILLNPRLNHFVDLFCACVLNASVGRNPSEMAIKQCPRCRKFFCSERKQYCSSECQWKSYWTPERRADDKWVRDLEKFAESCTPKYGRSMADLEKKLVSPRVEQRLKSIKKKAETEDWAGWSRISQRLEAIGKLTAKSQ